MQKNSVYILILAVLSLLSLGLVMLLSVSAFVPSNGGDSMFYISRQLMWLGVAFVACVVAASWDYHHWTRYAWVFVGVAIFLLILCHIPGLGREINGSNRWVRFGPVNFQPAEFAKLAIIAFLAYWLGQNQRRIHTFDYGFAYPLIVVGAVGLAILTQPDLGTTALMMMLTLLIMFTAGTKTRYLAPLPILGIIGILAIAYFIPERRARLISFMDPDMHRDGAGYQVWQALLAFGSGGIQGVGLGNGIQKMFYLPESHTDFIFPIIGEELGLIVTLLVVICFLVIALTGGFISMHAPEPTGTFLGLGATGLICLQAGMNISVVTGLIPPKGIGLPLISYGGSNLVLCLICIGILINIHRQAIYEKSDVEKSLPKRMNWRM